MAVQFKCRKFLHRLLEIIRELFIGKMAAVIVAWVMKNAVFYTIIIAKAGMLGKDPETLLEPEYADSHGAELMTYSFVTFLLLLLFAALLAHLVTHGGWSGFMHQSGLEQGVREVGGAAGLHVTALVDVQQASQVAAEMSNFYVAGLVFIPAWAYKGFVDRALEYFTLSHSEAFIETVQDATLNVANKTGHVAEDIGLDAAGDIVISGVETMTNLTGIGGDASDNAEANDTVNETNATNPIEVVAKTQEVLKELASPNTYWNILCFLIATCVAATVQVIAHTGVETLEGNHWDYLKQVFKSLETCMGLGTGSAFWQVFVDIFEHDSGFSWPLRCFYTIFITAVIVGTQIVMRKWLARKPNLNKCVVGGVKFIDKAYDFVIAWAWQAWLIGTFKPGVDLVLGEQNDECVLLYKVHFFVRASLITLFCVAVNAVLDVFRAALQVTPEIRQTALLITGVNAGWAWMFYAKSWFACDSHVQYNIWFVWGWSVAIIAGTLAQVFILDYLDDRVDKYVQELRKQAGTLDDKDDDSYWRQYDSSDESDSDDEDGGSDDDSEDHEKPVRP